MSEIPMAAIAAVLTHYELPGSLKSVEPIVQGHINHTYRIAVEQPTTGTIFEYVLQRINQHVFKQPEQVMHNIRQISRHVKGQENSDDCSILRFVDARSGCNYVHHDGEYWRLSPFVGNSVSYDVVTDSAIVCRVGYAFGRFQSVLADLPMSQLYATIPDFHNTPKRFRDFFAAVEEDPVGRAAGAAEDIAFLAGQQELASRLESLKAQGMLPLRVTHNDTKMNNILMDKDTGEPLCVVDLDTVMPGLVAMDFGDAIRTVGNTAVEDEQDVSKVQLHLDHYDAFARGFVGVCRSSLTPLEIDTLALGALTITLEQAVRFLGDYLAGDVYYRIHYPLHNWHRARCQLTLAKRMLERFETMEAIVRKYAFAENVQC